MNKRNFKAFLAVLLTVVMVFSIVPLSVSAEETTVTFDFSSLTGKGTEITSSNALSTFKGCASDDSYLTAVTTIKIYNGNGSGGLKANTAGFLKTGTSSVNGELTMTFTEKVNKVELVCHAWNTSGNDTVSVNGSAAQKAPTNGDITEKLTFEIDASETVSIVTAKRAFIKSITVYMAGSTSSEGGEVETPSDPVADSTLTVEEVIALGASKAHNVYTEGKYYVTGVITEVYNTQYGNMRITDEDGNILTIYGTYSADGKDRYDAMEVKPVVGDTVKIYGVVGQYNGTPQVKNGWIVEHTPAENQPEPDPKPEDPAADSTLTIEEVIALGASKDHNVYTEGKYYVTGVITEVYNTQYGNMKITDENGNILTIYGTYSADGADRYDAMEVKPVVGDTVKIYGVVGQYNGTPQVKNGWIVEHTPGEGEPEPEPKPEDPAADSTLTVEEVIALGASKDHNVYTEGKYYVTGVITEVYNTQYGNMKITDEDGNILTIYGTYSADGKDRYDAMEVKPAVGDTVKIYGVVGQYNGTPQVKNGWIVEHTPATPPTPPVTGDAMILLVPVVLLAGAALVVVSRKRRFN